MQELWGRILSGEVTKPGSYSLKTLEFMRNITKSDADLIVEMAKLAVFYSGTAILLLPLKSGSEQRGISILATISRLEILVSCTQLIWTTGSFESQTWHKKCFYLVALS
jgi:hypothetical protein